MKNNFKAGFTLMELLVVIGLIVLFAAMTTPYGINFYEEVSLEENADMLAQSLKKCQSRAIAGKEDSDWGVKISPDDQECSSCYVIFKGGSYDTRDENFDQVFTMTSEVSLDGVTEVVFEKGTGVPKKK